MDTPVTLSQTPVRLGRWATSKSLARSAWHALTLDKELIWLPLLSIISSLGLCTVFIGVLIGSGQLQMGDFTTGESASTDVSIFGPLSVFIYTVFYLSMTFVANFFAAALVAGFLERFRGGNPTVGSALKAAHVHAGAIFAFSLLSATIGLVLRAIEERVPLFGKVVTWVLGAAWAIASMFALPVIVATDKNVGPIKATKQSVGIITKTWGENVILSVGLGLVSVVTILAYFALSVGAWFVLAAFATASGILSIGFIPVAIFFAVVVLGFAVLCIIFNTLSAVIKTAIFHYATTGESPAAFEKQLLQQSFTSKKARGIFN